MGMREWLAIIVIVVIALILADGFRRKWLERRNSLRVKLDRRNIPPASADDDDFPSSELPGGGARVIPRTGAAPVRRAAAGLAGGVALRKGSATPPPAEPTPDFDFNNEPDGDYPDDDLDDGFDDGLDGGFGENRDDDVPVLTEAVDLRDTRETEPADKVFDKDPGQDEDADDDLDDDFDENSDDELTEDKDNELDDDFDDDFEDDFEEDEDEDEADDDLREVDEYISDDDYQHKGRGTAAVFDNEDFDDEYEDDFDDELDDGYQASDKTSGRHQERYEVDVRDEDDEDEDDFDDVPADPDEEEIDAYMSRFADEDDDDEDEDEEDESESDDYADDADDDDYEDDDDSLYSPPRQPAADPLFDEPRGGRREPVFNELDPLDDNLADERMGADDAAGLTPEHKQKTARSSFGDAFSFDKIKAAAGSAKAAGMKAAGKMMADISDKEDKESRKEAKQEAKEDAAAVKAQAKADKAAEAGKSAKSGKDKPEPSANKDKSARGGFYSRAEQAELFQEQEESDSEDSNPEPQEVIVINVMARQGELFAGDELLPVLMRQGMQLGGMSIFHKYADKNGKGPVMFSMANMVKPGTFDISLMGDFKTPGVSFFLQLPNAVGNMKSFEQMMTAANAVRDALDGELKDENRSVFTRQTMEHCRERIQDFELRQLTRK